MKALHNRPQTVRGRRTMSVIGRKHSTDAIRSDQKQSEVILGDQENSDRQSHNGLATTCLSKTSRCLKMIAIKSPALTDLFGT